MKLQSRLSFLQPTVEDYIPQVPLGAQDAALVLKEDELP
jgi:hypothetical protein